MLWDPSGYRRFPYYHVPGSTATGARDEVPILISRMQVFNPIVGGFLRVFCAEKKAYKNLPNQANINRLSYCYN